MIYFENIRNTGKIENLYFSLKLNKRAPARLFFLKNEKRSKMKMTNFVKKCQILVDEIILHFCGFIMLG